jgi:hypothetical protein
MATFDEIERHINERTLLRAQMETLRAQMAGTRNALASNETWLRANSALVRGWKLRASDAQKRAAGVPNAPK